jgi:hypothetical protein
MEPRMLIKAQRVFYKDTIDILIGEKYPDGSIGVINKMELEKIPQGQGYFGEPTLELDATSSQLLMDELWSCGIRPSEGSGSAGSLAATERHLKDMQKIAFRLLEPSISPQPSPDKSDQRIAP